MPQPASQCCPPDMRLRPLLSTGPPVTMATTPQTTFKRADVWPLHHHASCASGFPLLELLGFDPFCACGEICSVPLLVGLGLIKLAYQGEGNRNLKHKLTGAAGSRDQALTVAALLTRRESFPLAAAPRLRQPGLSRSLSKVRCSYIKTAADRQTGR